MRTRLKPLALLVAIVVMVLLLPVTHAAPADVALPRWPQKFEIPQGMTRYYAFPVTQAGKVVVDLTWSGPALTVSLVDVDGKVLSTLPNQPTPSAHPSFALSAADVGKSNVYAIALAVPTPKLPATPPTPTPQRKLAASIKPPPTPVASGTISVNAPPLDHAVLQPKLKTFVAQRQAKLAAINRSNRPAAVQSSSALLAARNSEGVKALTTQRQALQSQMNSKVAARAQTLRASIQTVQRAAIKTTMLRNVRTRTVRLPKNVQVPPTSKYAKPTILRGTPDATGPAGGTGGGTGGGSASAVSGFPGDEIVLKVGGIDPNAANTVAFTVHTSAGGGSSIMSPQGTIYGASVNGDAVELVVGVPYAGDVRDAAASIVVRDPSGNASAPFSFTYNPIPLPTITGVRLAEGVAGPGRSLLLDGSGFGTGAKAYFKQIPGAAAAVAAGASSAGTPGQNLLPARIPTYTSDSQFVAAVYVSYHYQHKHFDADLQGADFPVTLDATSVTLTSADRTTGTPGSALLLGGNGFTSKGEVHCVVGAGKDLTAQIVSYNDTAILINIPDYAGIVQPVTGTLYVKRPDGLKSNLLSFAFAPQMVHQHIDLSKYMGGAQWMFRKGNQLDRWELQDNGTRVWGHHETDFWNGSSGTDVAFWWSDGWPLVGAAGQPLAMYLKNGWTVSVIDWWQAHPNNDIFETIHYTAHPGTGDPAVFVSWWMRIFVLSGQVAEYSFAIDIYGPKGTDYF